MMSQMVRATAIVSGQTAHVVRCLHLNHVLFCASRPPGSFCGLQLLPGASLEAIISALHKHLAAAVMNYGPYEMRWLKDLKGAKVSPCKMLHHVILS